MILDKIIAILSEYLDDIDIDETTMLFMEYDLEDDDIQDIISRIQEELDVEIDSDEFCDMSSVNDIAEYVEEIMA